MKILELDLAAFGPFANQSLDFREGQFGLHLILRPQRSRQKLHAAGIAAGALRHRTPDARQLPHPL